MRELPSLCRSTLSILAVFAVVAYAAAAGFVAYATAFHQMPQGASAQVMKPFELLMMTFGASYLTARRAGQNGEAKPPEIKEPEKPLAA